MSSNKPFRTETDSMGDVQVPANAYYGAQTKRAVDNFPVSGMRMPRSFIRALAMIKRSAAQVNADLGLLDRKLADAIIQAAQEVMAGTWDDHFPIDVFQTGSGTSTNMNVNEVISNRAIEILGGHLGSKSPVHPNDHVNMGQSSNDVIPTTIHIAGLESIERDLFPALKHLHAALDAKAKEFDDIVKIGRTHLQDAVPIRLGQEFSGYASMLEHDIRRLEAVCPHLAELALGGTAVGTGLNARPGFSTAVIEKIAEMTGIAFQQAPNLFEALASRDAVVEASGALRTVACSVMKIANDVRLMSAGPRCGIGEISLPSLQPGSSIMPGKVNPVIAEAVRMICAQVQGNDLAIAIGGQGGELELNVMLPMIAHNLLQSVTLLAKGARLFADRCISGIEANRERCEGLIEDSLAMCTALAPIIGYDAAARIAKEAFATGKTVRQVAKEHNVLPADELNKVLDPRSMTN